MRRRLAFASAVVALGCGACAHRTQIRYTPGEDPSEPGRFTVAPVELSAGENEHDFARAFTVHVADEDADLPPIAGTHSLAGDTLEFEPRFALSPGLRYRATYAPKTGPPVVSEFALPPERSEPVARVDFVTPSAPRLPENLLKFYIHFSHPMTQGQAWDHLELLDPAGKPVELPFLEIDEELWDPYGKRLTVLIDPGRIKREVKPLEDLGPALVEGGTYTLRVSSAWEDARGAPLVSTFERRFEVTAVDRRSPVPAEWRIVSPRAGTLDALVVELGESLDHALLFSSIGVTRTDGSPVDGAIAVGDHETLWRFVPAGPWQEGTHELVVSTGLEDLAGNRVDRPFEVDAERAVEYRLSESVVRLPFVVGGILGRGSHEEREGDAKTDEGRKNEGREE